MTVDEDETGSDEALVGLSIEPETLSFSEIEAILGPSAPTHRGRPQRNWIAEFGRPVRGQGTPPPTDVTLNASLGRLEDFLRARAEQLARVASGANFLVMITWTVHLGASPVTMTPALIQALGALNAAVWIDG